MRVSLSLTIHKPQVVQLWQVKHDWEIPVPRLSAPAPEVNRLDPFVHVLMTEAIQWFTFGLLEKQAGSSMTHDQVVQAWHSLYGSTTAFCNGNGVGDNRDYITGNIYSEHQLLPLPKFFPLVCGGNVLTGDPVNIKGIDLLMVEHIESAPTSNVSRVSYPWLVQWANITACNDPPYKVFRFPQLSGLDVPVPVMASGKVTFPMSRLKKLPPGSPVPSPYYP